LFHYTMNPITNTTLHRRDIPSEDMKLSNGTTDDEYTDGVFCECGAVIIFRNRRPYEPVRVKCPLCNSVIYYG